MSSALWKSLSLIDVSGIVIMVVIVTFLLVNVGLTLYMRGRYAHLEHDLRDNGGTGAFRSKVLNRILQEVEDAQSRASGELNTQAIVEHGFYTELRGLLIGERLVKSATGLMIILGLVGTFYGLTLSIGKLVVLLSSDVSGDTALTQSLTHGLTQALSGMSVAFSCSLFGIVSSIIMTLVGVFLNVTDRRTAVMVKIESFLDHVVLAGGGALASADPGGIGAGPGLSRGAVHGLDGVVLGFRDSVAQLEAAIGSFHGALELFSTNTRDFGEFNAHLKDNISRMSLGFADLSETLRTQAEAIKSRGRG